jgi:hypothetical protein
MNGWKHSHDGLFGVHGWLHDVEGCPSCHSAARLVLGNQCSTSMVMNNTTICKTLTPDAIESLGKGHVIILEDLEDLLL